MMIPATGTRAAPVKGTAPDAKITARVGSTPEAMATPTHGHARGASIRRDEVIVATASMKTPNRIDQTTWPSTAVITRATTMSWMVARSAAVPS